MRKYVSAATLVVGWTLLAMVGVALWLHHFPSRGLLTIYLTAVVPFAVIPAVVAIVIFGVLRRWFMLAFAVCATVALIMTQAPLWVAHSAPSGHPITVVSANLLFGEADVDALSKLIAESDADLVSLQEVTPEALARIRGSEIVRQLPHEYAIPYPLAAGTALLSRTPLTEPYNIDGTVLHNLAASTDLPGAPGTRVLAVHPGAPLDGKADVWVRDMDILTAHLRSLPAGPVIVAGDFNVTWDNARYRALLDLGFADAAEQAGAGFLPTYPTDRFGGQPVVAIDHVITRGFVATSMRTAALPGSDHRAVVVRLVASSER